MLAIRARLTGSREEVMATSRNLKHPIFLRLRTSDVTLLRSILVDCEYDLRLSVEPRVIVDAGANIGFASVYFANRYPKARIIAIEPEPQNYRLLTKNIKPYSNIQSINAALWHENAAVEVIDPGLGNWGFRTCSAGAELSGPQRVGTVSAITLDRIMAEFDLGFIDLLKVDIEGAEKEIFKRSDGWMNRIGTIAMEVHEHLVAGSEDSVTKAAKDFESVARQGEKLILSRHKHALKDLDNTSYEDSDLWRGLSIPLKVGRVR